MLTVYHVCIQCIHFHTIPCATWWPNTDMNTFRKYPEINKKEPSHWVSYGWSERTGSKHIQLGGVIMASRFTAQNLRESREISLTFLDVCSFERSHSPEMPMVYWWSWSQRIGMNTGGWGPQQANYELPNLGQNFEARERIRPCDLSTINWNGAISISQHA